MAADKPKIMVVGAHADDIEILAGGTLWKYHQQGHEVVYVMSTDNMSGSVSTLQQDGTITSTHEPPELMSARRKHECAGAAALLGTTPIQLDHPQRHYRDAAGVAHELRYGCERPAGSSANGRSGCHARLVCTNSQPDQALEASTDLRLALPCGQR